MRKLINNKIFNLYKQSPWLTYDMSSIEYEKRYMGWSWILIANLSEDENAQELN